jgi:hypothetical protein
LGTLSASEASSPSQTIVCRLSHCETTPGTEINMTPEDHTHAIHALQTDVSEIKAILNNGIRTMVNDQKTELATVKDDIQSIRNTLTSHVAKEDIVYEIFKRVMNTGVSITGALIALLLAIIGRPRPQSAPGRQLSLLQGEHGRQAALGCGV